MKKNKELLDNVLKVIAKDREKPNIKDGLQLLKFADESDKNN